MDRLGPRVERWMIEQARALGACKSSLRRLRPGMPLSSVPQADLIWAERMAMAGMPQALFARSKRGYGYGFGYGDGSGSGDGSGDGDGYGDGGGYGYGYGYGYGDGDGYGDRYGDDYGGGYGYGSGFGYDYES